MNCPKCGYELWKDRPLPPSEWVRIILWSIAAALLAFYAISFLP